MNSKLAFLIIGASGYMGHHLYNQLSKKHPVQGTYASNPFPGGIHFDLINSNPKTLPIAKAEYAVIFSAVTKIDLCKSKPELSRKINVEGIRNLLIELKRCGVSPIYASSDGVYPSIHGNYEETCQEPAVHMYGEQKREVEYFIQKHFQKYCILRFSKVVGYDEKKSDLLSDLYDKLITGSVLKLVRNQKFQVVSLPDMVAVIEQVVKKNMTGVFNIATPETISRKDLAERLANLLAIKNLEIQELPVSHFNFIDERTVNSSMKIDRFLKMSGFTFEPVDKVLSNFLKEIRNH